MESKLAPPKWVIDFPYRPTVNISKIQEVKLSIFDMKHYLVDQSCFTNSPGIKDGPPQGVMAFPYIVNTCTLKKTSLKITRATS